MLLPSSRDPTQRQIAAERGRQKTPGGHPHWRPDLSQAKHGPVKRWAHVPKSALAFTSSS